MNERVLRESEKGSKNVCYLVLSHGMQVDLMGQVLNFLENEGKVPYENNVPYNYFSNVMTEERVHKIVVSQVQNKAYYDPTFCAITGFQIDHKNIKSVFGSYNEHV